MDISEDTRKAADDMNINKNSEKITNNINNKYTAIAFKSKKKKKANTKQSMTNDETRVRENETSGLELSKFTLKCPNRFIYEELKEEEEIKEDMDEEKIMQEIQRLKLDLEIGVENTGASLGLRTALCGLRFSGYCSMYESYLRFPGSGKRGFV